MLEILIFIKKCYKIFVSCSSVLTVLVLFLNYFLTIILTVRISTIFFESRNNVKKKNILKNVKRKSKRNTLGNQNWCFLQINCRTDCHEVYWCHCHYDNIMTRTSHSRLSCKRICHLYSFFSSFLIIIIMILCIKNWASCLVQGFI